MDLLEFPNNIAILFFSLYALFCVIVVIYDCCRSVLSASPNRGLNKRVLNSLPKLTFSKTSAGVHSLSDSTICLAEFGEGEEIRVLPHCGHGYHVICIDLWLVSHSTCPSCRQIPMMPVSAKSQNCGRSSSGVRENPSASMAEDLVELEVGFLYGFHIYMRGKN